MSVQKVLQVTSPLLRQKSKPVTGFDKKIERLIADLTDTLLAQKNPVGVGLAAPQIGKNVCIFVIKSGKNIIPFINPKIIRKSTSTNGPVEKPKNENQSPITNHQSHEYIMEGCLSLPHYYGPVQRANKIKVTYQILKPTLFAARRATENREPPADNRQLKTENRTFSGLLAQIIQHEIDHLNGLLFVDRLLEQKRKLFQLKGKEWEEVELP